MKNPTPQITRPGGMDAYRVGAVFIAIFLLGLTCWGAVVILKANRPLLRRVAPRAAAVDRQIQSLVFLRTQVNPLPLTATVVPGEADDPANINNFAFISEPTGRRQFRELVVPFT